MRDAAADAYRTETGDVWRPRRSSHTSQTGYLTSAAIDACDFMRARKDRETRAHLLEGTLVAIAGGKDVRDAGAIFARVDKTRAKYPDMVLAHGGGPGVERNGVHQVVCKPDWDRHGRAAPRRRAGRRDRSRQDRPSGILGGTRRQRLRVLPPSGTGTGVVDTALKRPRAQSVRLSPSSKRTRLASRHGKSERSSGGSSSVGRRAGRLEVELRRMRALRWRPEVDRSRFLPQ